MLFWSAKAGVTGLPWRTGAAADPAAREKTVMESKFCLFWKRMVKALKKNVEIGSVIKNERTECRIGSGARLTLVDRLLDSI